MVRIAYFISPHGFGHAARASAVMDEIARRCPGAVFELYTTVPESFFEGACDATRRHHPLLTDIGLVQTDALHEDIPATIRRLDQLLPYDANQIDGLADELSANRCDCVICDISPMGLVAARQVGIPGVLVENFTWDWIYEAYLDNYPHMATHATYFADIFGAAPYRIRTRPWCGDVPAELHTEPVSRPHRTPAAEVRRQLLGASGTHPAVLISMGGIVEKHRFLDELAKHADITFVIPGGSNKIVRRDNLILLPHHSSFYHPDLVNACTALIGKVGYSTIAEVYHAGIPFGFISRDTFRETGPLVDFVRQRMPSLPFEEDEFRSGRWLKRLPELLALPRRTHDTERPDEINGANQIAEFVLNLI